MLGREVNANRGSVASLVLLAGLNSPCCLAIRRECSHPTQPAEQQHTVLLKRLLGRKGLPGGWGVRGSAASLPVVGHGFNREDWRFQEDLALRSLSSRGCPWFFGAVWLPSVQREAAHSQVSGIPGKAPY